LIFFFYQSLVLQDLPDLNPADSDFALLLRRFGPDESMIHCGGKAAPLSCAALLKAMGAPALAPLY
jgi:hypothetical protein